MCAFEGAASAGPPPFSPSQERTREMPALSQRVAIIALGGAACIIFYLKYPSWWKRVRAEESGSKQEDIEMAGSNTSAELSFITAHQNGGESVDGPSSNTEMGDIKDLVQCGKKIK